MKATVTGFDCTCVAFASGVRLQLTQKGRARLAASEGDQLEVVSNGYRYTGVQRGTWIEIAGASIDDFTDSVRIRRTGEP